MHPIEPPDSHYVSAALGWLELGNAAEARRELAQVNSMLAGHPHVLEVRWQLHAREQDWAAALAVAQEMVARVPHLPAGWLHRAYALRRVPGGGLEQAWDALLPAAHQFPDEVLIAFNLACYACQMNRLPEARDWLKRALERGSPTEIKLLTLQDEDLRPLWPEIAAW